MVRLCNVFEFQTRDRGRFYVAFTVLPDKSGNVATFRSFGVIDSAVKQYQFLLEKLIIVHF